MKFSAEGTLRKRPIAQRNAPRRYPFQGHGSSGGNAERRLDPGCMTAHGLFYYYISAKTVMLANRLAMLQGVNQRNAINARPAISSPVLE